MKARNRKPNESIKHEINSEDDGSLVSDNENELSEELSVHESDDNEEFEENAEESFIPGRFVRKRVLDDKESEQEKKKIKKNNDLYKAPTAEELSQLRETENLFHSNLFRLQIEEILSQVKLKEKYKNQFDTWFMKLQKNIEQISETEEKELSDTKSLRKLGIKIPDIDVPVNQKGSYRFAKPSKISVIGSHSLNTTIGPNVVIDVMVMMPSSLFKKHDYQDYRYMRKRSIYLSYIAANLSDEIVKEKKFIGQTWMPKLLIIPTGSLSKRVKIHLHIGAEQSSFKLNRFLPEKNLIRPNWLFNDTKNYSTLPSTPHYSFNILHDLIMLDMNNHNAKMINEYPNLRDGIILLKIWLYQRQPEKSYNGFNGHILTMYVLYLLYERKLNTFMSSYQIIRNVWNNFAQSDWSTNGITMCKDNEAKIRVADYHKFYDCVFLDATGYHNLVANLTIDNYKWIRSEADVAVKCLDNASIDSFQILFMKPMSFHTIFDHFICFNDTTVLDNLYERIPNNKKLDFGVNKQSQVISVIVNILKEALGSRVSLIYVKPDEYKEWNITEKCTSDIDKIFIGLQLDPEFCFNIIEKGPPANEPEAKKFRDFWGNKSELRRFQDGLICEAVVWGEGKTIAEKRMITKQITMFILKSKLDISKHEYFYCGNQIDEFLQLKNTKITKFSYGTGEEAALQALQVFDTLEKQLISLTDLPLPITGVNGISPVLRYTDVFPPLSTTYKPDEVTIKEGEHCLLINEDGIEKLPKSAPAIMATIQLCTSGKWPDELEAVRKTKAAFNIQIAECLRKNFSLKAHGNYRYIDIFKDGYLFRLEVAHQKEIALLKQIVGEDGVIKYRDNDESIELENRLFHLPKLNGALNGLHSQQPSFGPTCCLIKRWLAAHLLDASHISEIVIELLVASMYLNPYPYKPVQIPQVGLLRFLEFFARDLWNTEPIIVNFNSEMTREEIVAVENHFGSCRGTLSPLFISTPYDHTNSIWTIKNPSKLILNRIGSLAKEVLKIVDTQIMKHCKLVWRPMFESPTSGYDVLIHLKGEFNPRRLQYLDPDDRLCKETWRPYKSHSDEKIPIIDFNPVEKYLEELRNGYGEFALFFHDTYGGCIIGVLLKPTALEAKDFKVTNMNCRRINSDGKLILNISAMIEDFSILGRGLVENIDVQSKNINLN